MKQYSVEVQADSTGTWAGNGKQFDTEEKDTTYALDLYMRWTSVRKWRIVEAERSEGEDDEHIT